MIAKDPIFWVIYNDASKDFEKRWMPEVSRFYGIVIKVFFGDHSPPHFHAIYGEYNALINIDSLEVFEGDLPSRAEKLVLEWATLYQKELLQMCIVESFISFHL